MEKIITISVSDYLSFELAEKISAAQWHSADWRGRIVRFLYDYKSESDIFNVVAFAEDKIIGRVQCIQSIEDHRIWCVGDLFVIPEYHRRHIAEKMLNTALETMGGRGCRIVRSYIEPDNLPSLGLHKKLGFQEAEYTRFDGLINEDDIMLERKPRFFTVAPADEEEAIYICECCEKNAESLHFGEAVSPEFYRNIKKMLSDRDPDEANFLIYIGAFPCGWLKLNGLENAESAWISMLVIEPKFHRMGAGFAAVEYAENFFRSLNKRKACIRTTEDNIAARGLYESCGYAVKKTLEDTAADGVQRKWTVFEKELI